MTPYLPDEVLINIFITGCEYEQQYAPDSVIFHPRRRKAFAALARNVCVRWRNLIDHSSKRDFNFWIIRTGIQKSSTSDSTLMPMFKRLILLRAMVANSNDYDLELYFIYNHGPSYNHDQDYPRSIVAGRRSKIKNQDDENGYLADEEEHTEDESHTSDTTNHVVLSANEKLELQQLFLGVLSLIRSGQRVVKLVIHSDLLEASNYFLQLMAHLSPFPNLRHLDMKLAGELSLLDIWRRGETRKFHSLIAKEFPPNLSRTACLDTLVFPGKPYEVVTPEVHSLSSIMHLYNTITATELSLLPLPPEANLLNITKLELKVYLWFSRSRKLVSGGNEDNLHCSFPKLRALLIHFLSKDSRPRYEISGHVAEVLKAFSRPTLESLVVRSDGKIIISELSEGAMTGRLTFPNLLRLDLIVPSFEQALILLALCSMHSHIHTLNITFRRNKGNVDVSDPDIPQYPTLRLSHLRPRQLALISHTSSQINDILSTRHIETVEKLTLISDFTSTSYEPIKFHFPNLKKIHLQFFTFWELSSIFNKLRVHALHQVTIKHRDDPTHFTAFEHKKAVKYMKPILSVRAVGLYFLGRLYGERLDFMNYIAPNTETLFICIECGEWSRSNFIAWLNMLNDREAMKALRRKKSISLLYGLGRRGETGPLFQYLQVLYIRIVLDEQAPEDVGQKVKDAFDGDLLNVRDYGSRRLKVRSIDVYQKELHARSEKKEVIDVFMTREGASTSLGPDLLSLLNAMVESNIE